jgi:Ca2+-binding EF-hand superfamily protein
MNFTSRQFSTAAVAALLAASAFAGEEKAHDPMASPGLKDPIEAEMRLMDTNKDGKVTASEHAGGAQEMFKAMDANQDNRVSAAEMDATQKPWKSQDAAHHKGAMSSAEKIKAIDTNGDGVLSAQEHATGSKKMFMQMDGDKDGNLTSAEIKAGHKDLMMSKDE